MRNDRAKEAKERGSILLHVMVTAILIALIAASLLRMMMLRYQMIARSENALVEKRSDQLALSALVASWNSANNGEGVTCSSGGPTYSCSPARITTPGVCGCTCIPSSNNAFPATMPTVIAWNSNNNCALDIQSADLMH